MSTVGRKKHANRLLERALRIAACGAHGIIINNHAQCAKQIRVQVEALVPFFEFIGYGELKTRLEERPRAKPFCLLTFDDGKAVNALETAPELRRLGVPAVFYIVTGLTGMRRALWFNRLTAVRHAVVNEPLPDYSELEAIGWREREQRVDALCSRYGIDADLDDPTVRLMSWEDAAQLERDGFEIGSHTVDHALLPEEDAEEAERQITESVRQIRQHGLRCRTFAFPKGRLTSELVCAAHRAGLESTMSTVPTWIRRRDQLACLPRLYIKDSACRRDVLAKILAARPGCLLGNPSGEGRRYLMPESRRKA